MPHSMLIVAATIGSISMHPKTLSEGIKQQTMSLAWKKIYFLCHRSCLGSQLTQPDATQPDMVQ